jgi:hypothetical protein
VPNGPPCHPSKAEGFDRSARTEQAQAERRCRQTKTPATPPHERDDRTNARIIRAWATVAIALVAAAISDAVSEDAENLGLLSASAHDYGQQAVAPTLLLGIAVIVLLALYVAVTRVVPGNQVAAHLHNWRGRVVDAGAALACGSVLLVAMENYETAFGGPPALGPDSIVVAHAPTLFAALILTTIAVRMLLSVLIRFAIRTGDGAAQAIATFLPHLPRVKDPTFSMPPFVACAATLQPAIAGFARGLRAPPLL